MLSRKDNLRVYEVSLFSDEELSPISKAESGISKASVRSESFRASSRRSSDPGVVSRREFEKLTIQRRSLNGNTDGAWDGTPPRRETKPPAVIYRRNLQREFARERTQATPETFPPPPPPPPPPRQQERLRAGHQPRQVSPQNKRQESPEGPNKPKFSSSRARHSSSTPTSHLITRKDDQTFKPTMKVQVSGNGSVGPDLSKAKAVKVVLRCRPSRSATNDGCWLNISSATDVQLKSNDLNREVACILPPGNHMFSFDKVLPPACTQDEAFQEALPVVENFLKNRKSGAVIAYGQTATGKTHTMGLLPLGLTDANLGCLPRAISRLFRDLSSVEVTAFELYLDQVRDLLVDPESPSPDLENTRSNLNSSILPIREKQGKIFVQGLKQVLCTSAKDCWRIIRQAAERRERKETEMNKVSSRSHAIIAIASGGAVLSFVDLAGSERVSRTMSDVKEAAFINSSLASLGNVVRALSTGATFVPYRDSKLTRILQGCLDGGNVVLFATVSMESKNILETLSTLKFAERCSKVIVSKSPVRIVDADSLDADSNYAWKLKLVLEGLVRLSNVAAAGEEVLNLDRLIALSDDEFSTTINQLMEQVEGRITKEKPQPINYEQFSDIVEDEEVVDLDVSL